MENVNEELYSEFKKRLLMEGFVVNKSDPKDLLFLKPARDHFKLRQEQLRKISDEKSWSDWTDHNLCLICYGWDNIRKLVLWSYGCNTIRQLPEDKEREINEYTIKIIDIIFDQYKELWKES